MSQFIATLGYVGYLKPASGTWGSAAAVLLAWPIYLLGGWVALLLASILAFGAGVWATQQMTQNAQDHDPSEIVIDEAVGQWIALLPVAIGATVAGHSPLQLWPGIVTAFLAFRLFDIWKPLWVGKADKRSDALGVMLDDVIAGAMAAVVVLLLAAVSHLGLGI
ncbi:MAG: phosphatidylglycerophosphatase A [Pseudomonadota bacterium]